MSEYYVHCSKCGKPVCGPLAHDVVVRAWVECPECIKAEGDLVANAIDENVAAEREASREIARQEMLRLQEWEQHPHPDNPDEEEKARGGWMAARAIAEAIDARAGQEVVRHG